MSLNLAYFLDASAQRYRNKTALILDDLRMTYAELMTAAKKVANILKEKGIKKGDKVAMMIPNTPHFPIIYYGILNAGATVVPLNCMLKSNEIQYQLEDSDAEVFFVWKGFLEEAKKAFIETETCHHLIVVSALTDLDPPPVGEAFTPLLLAAPAEFDMVQTMPEDTAVILYTSGTTGTPKGAELTHFNVFFNAFYAKDHIVQVLPEDVGLVVLPLFHSFGMTCVMNVGLLAGATLSMIPQFDTQRTMEIIQRDKVTFALAVPTMFFWMLNLENHKDYDLSSLRIAVSGGSALPVEVLAKFEERYGIRILEGYGLTETSPVASFNMPDKPSKPGSIGTPIWGCEMRLMNDDGRFVGVGEIGEIVVRGHNVMKGYYKKPGATEAAIVNGWFHTGDLAKMDEDGYFFIVDRKKDLIIRGGMNIYPREIEEVLYGHPDVVEVCVIGVPDQARGEEVKAYVALRQAARGTPEELRAYCQERMARYKVPKEVEILPSLPKGPTGKLLKRKLREMALAQQRGKTAE
jgi:long-chain acyl-CoA synthetase